MNEKAITYYVLRDLSRSTKTSGMIKCRILGSVSAVEFYIYIRTCNHASSPFWIQHLLICVITGAGNARDNASHDKLATVTIICLLRNRSVPASRSRHWFSSLYHFDTTLSIRLSNLKLIPYGTLTTGS